MNDSKKHSKQKYALWALRTVFSFVFLLNIQCALSFVIWPEHFTAAYELSGAQQAGSVAIAGMGIAFLMWNATYPFYLVKPQSRNLLGLIILVQQAIGLVGETWILFSLPSTLPVLRASITQFLLFDGFDFFAMLLVFILFKHVNAESCTDL